MREREGEKAGDETAGVKKRTPYDQNIFYVWMPVDCCNSGVQT